MIVNSVNSNYAQNNQKIKQSIHFNGELGNKFVNDIISGADLEPKVLIKEMNGIFGIKTNKAEDILESFIGKVKELWNDKISLSNKINEQEREIREFPKQKNDAVCDAEAKIRASYQSLIEAKNREIATKNNEIADVKSQLKKYEQVVKVKSIEEIDTIMPDKTIELIDEMIKNKIPARKSMVDFLLSGKGQEDALAQIERNNMVMKAQQDGITEISEVKAKIDNDMRHSGTLFSTPYYYTLNMIENALKGTSKSEYLKSSVIRKQVKENAMAILTPMANDKYSNESVGAISKKLDEMFNNVIKYRDGIVKVIEKVKENKSNYPNAEFKLVEYSPEDSKIVCSKNGRYWEQSFFID